MTICRLGMLLAVLGLMESTTMRGADPAVDYAIAIHGGAGIEPDTLSAARGCCDAAS